MGFRGYGYFIRAFVAFDNSPTRASVPQNGLCQMGFLGYGYFIRAFVAFNNSPTSASVLQNGLCQMCFRGYGYFIRAFVAFDNSPFYLKVNRDKVKLNIHQSNFFVRFFSGTIFTPGAGAAKGLIFFRFLSALVREARNKKILDQHHKNSIAFDLC